MQQHHTVKWNTTQKKVHTKKKRTKVARFESLQFFPELLNIMNHVPSKQYCCQTEFAEFKVFLERVVSRRGKRREKHVLEFEEFFCDKVYEIMMRQRGYFTEVLDREKVLKARLQSILNEKSFLEDQNFDLRQKLASKDVFFT